MNKAIILRVASVAVALVGAVIVWRSTVWGIRIYADTARVVGGLSGSQIEVTYAGAVMALRTIGGVLLGVGIFRALEYPGKE